MLRDLFHNLSGIEIYGIVSLCLFVSVFGALVIWALGQKQSHLKRMAHLPLEADAEPSNGTNSYERPTQ